MRKARSRLLVLVLWGACSLTAACSSRKNDKPNRPAPEPDAAADLAVEAADAAASASRSDAGSSDASTTGLVPLGDAGVSACRVVQGPIELPVVGPVALVPEGEELLVVSNDFGQPSAFRFPAGAIPPPNVKVATPPRPPLHASGSWPACSVTAHYYFCPGRGGAMVMRKRTTGDPGREVAKGKPGTRSVGVEYGDHWAVASIVEKVTTEGRVLTAQIVIDGKDPETLSDEGAGATFVDLAPHEGGALAFTLDARTAMVPLHVRTLGDRGLGKDYVVGVGGPPERGVAGVLGTTAKRAFALVPMPEDATLFGLAVVPLAAPLKEDLPIVWSRYPNGLDPAPVAASRGAERVYVARVRPVTADKDATRGLELGVLDEAGAFGSLGFVHTGAVYADPSVALDGKGGLWVAYTVPASAGSLTFLERRACPR